MVKEMRKKDLAAILYYHYLDNYCQDDFSFDKGKLRNKIEKCYNELKNKLTEEALNKIKSKIKCYEEEGTDYDALYFKFKEVPELSLQVTSLIDYKGKRVDGYKGNCQWADVGMFWLDGDDYEFDDF